MTSREKARAVFDRKGSGEGLMWTGHPNDLTIPIYAKAWGIGESREAIFNYLHDDCRWVIADSGYRHPEGRPAIDPSYGVSRKTLSGEGCFANAETYSDIDKYPWPDVKDCDFTEIYSQIEQFPDKMVFTGMWCPFFHNASDMFGMENYFVLMYENPKLVEYVTERIVDYYTEANEKFFSGLCGRADVMFFGNDFGTQRDLFLSPENFRRFVLPSLKRLIAVGKKYGKKVMLHSCGSIYRVIPDLIACGVDALHPLQARAAGMCAAELAQYKNDLAFVGGIDAQHILPFGSPPEVAAEVRRVRGILGPNIVISASHEEILPNIPPENIAALEQTAHNF